MRGFTFEQILLLALLAVGLLLRWLRAWDARRRSREHRESAPARAGRADREANPSSAPRPRRRPARPAFPQAPQTAMPREGRRPWPLVPQTPTDWRQAVVLAILLGPPRASEPGDGWGARSDLNPRLR